MVGLLYESSPESFSQAIRQESENTYNQLHISYNFSLIFLFISEIKRIFAPVPR